MNKKRKQILDAAHQLFIDKGFALTSIQDILDKAKIAKGTFYNYFNSKNECLLAIMESVTEDIDKKRRELALGKELNDQEVFIQQIAVRMDMNKQHHLLAVFESVSFSEDTELKTFMHEQFRAELRWIAWRLSHLYTANARCYTLDHAVMLVGIIHHMMHVWKLGSTKEIAIEKIIRYALKRVQSMLDEQMETDDTFFPEQWLGTTIDDSETNTNQAIHRLERLKKKIKDKGTPKQFDLINFLITELQAKEPRSFLIESVLASLEQAFAESNCEYEVKQIVQLAF